MIELARTPHYVISRDSEAVLLSYYHHGKTVIGDFHGGRQMAVIDSDEKWCVVGGHGLIVYFLYEPFSEYRSGLDDTQYTEAGRHVGSELQVDDITQTGPWEFRIVLESGDVRTVSIEWSPGGSALTVR